MNWKKIKETVVFKGWRSIIQKTFELPNGKAAIFDIVSTNDFVTIIAFTKNKEAILKAFNRLKYEISVSEDLTNNQKKQVLHVSNNGSLFKGDESKLGELYYRHNPSSGSGLGLHIVSSLVKSMGGDIRFSNNPFKVDLFLTKGPI